MWKFKGYKYKNFGCRQINCGGDNSAAIRLGKVKYRKRLDKKHSQGYNPTQNIG